MATDGSALHTARALGALTGLAEQTSAACLAELAAWAEETFSSSTSVRVVKALQQLRATGSQVDFIRPTLPIYDLGRAPQLTGLPVEYEVYRDHLEKVLNNDDQRYPYGGVDWVLADVLNKHPSWSEQLIEEHVARVLLAAGANPFQRSGLTTILNAADPSPLFLSAVADRQGVRSQQVVSTVGAVLAAIPGHWTDSELTDWVAYHADGIIDYLGSAAHRTRTGVYTALARAERRPPHLDDLLVVQAVTNTKERADLYRAVGPPLITRILPFLASRSKAERRGAADWLGHHGSTEAVEPLLTAARAESDDRAKAAILSALERLDAPIAEFVSPDVITADAKRIMGRKSGWPQSLSWLDPASLPSLRWSDGTPVAPEVGQWLVAAATKGRAAEPSPILQRQLAAMEPASVHTFGRTLLDWWLTEDEQSDGAAVTSKGIVAVVAAAASGDVVDRAVAYLRRHRGKRRKQGEALIEMLAWLDDPLAVQALLAIANRFRPKRFSDLASSQAELLAERKGWTVDDLADRSVPDAGFNADGRRVFDYGSRSFTALLADDLSLRVINDENGKPIRALPRGRADEDAERIKELRADLSAAKKDLTTTASAQPERLHQAMCAGRSWPAADFLDHLVRHPVMARLAARLIWRAAAPPADTAGDAGASIFFRPLTDGTLLDVGDEAVELDPAATVTLAHSQWMSDVEQKAWSEHLADYDVVPLFPQLGRAAYHPPDPDRLDVEEFSDHVMKEGTLRRQAAALGWQNGFVDGFEGSMYEVVKPNPSAGLTAVLALKTGISVRHHDAGADVTLRSLAFVPIGEASDRMAAIPLGEVPPVMLSEMVTEARILALLEQPEGTVQ